MSEQQPHAFDDALLSGYVDGELTQAEDQKVRIYLEDHPEARAVVAEIQRLRAAARTTSFKIPDDQLWDERPRSRVSWIARAFGWVGVLGAAGAVAGVGTWELVTAPFGILPKLVACAAVFGLGSLFLSVLLDHLRSLPHDRYRRVEK